MVSEIVEKPARIYLDHNASTPLAREAANAMAGVLEDGAWGNPSSIHAEGRMARELVERGRSQISTLLSTAADELVLTSSGTESVALGLIGAARAAVSAGGPPRVLVASTEHPCVHGAADALAAEGFAVAKLAVGSSGVVDLDRARAQIAGGASVVAIALANHETGAIQPVSDIAALSHELGALVFCDAVAAAGKLSLDPAALGVDALAISAHKFYGPKGVGALWLDRKLQIDSVLGGGHQERERRPGTENVIGVVGAGAAAVLAASQMERDASHGAELAGSLEEGIAALGGEVLGADVARVSSTTCARFEGAPADMLVQALDLAGFAVSAGAACTSGTLEPSAVLLAMGYEPAEAREAIRISTGRSTTQSDVKALLSALGEIVPRVQRFAG